MAEIENNPQQNQMVNVHTAYMYATRQNISWNDPEYQPLKNYVDPIQQITQRKYLTQKKGERSNKYQTKRGSFMDHHIKRAQKIPASCQYSLNDGFDQTQNKKKAKTKKIDQSLSKHTYLDRIAIQQKNRKTPAPGFYNLMRANDKSKKDKKTRSLSACSRRFFYQQFQGLSTQTPGAGWHNPHLQISHLKVEKKDHKYWIQEHKKMSQSFHKKRLSEPDPGSYNPVPLSVTTFDRIRSADEKNRKKKPKTTFFGTDSKFTYNRPSKIVNKEKRPDPISYDTQIKWKGKNDSNKEKKNWSRSLSTGIKPSIYH